MATIGDFVLGIPTLARYDLLARLLDSVRHSTNLPTEVCIVDNGGVCPEFDIGRPIRIIKPDHNLGLAESLNVVGRLYRPSDIFFAHDDVVLRPNSFEIMLEHDAALVLGVGWGFAFYLHREAAWREVGEYDPAFWPAYWQDNDYKLRAVRAGLAIDGMENAADHDGSATVRVAFDSPASWFERNRRLYFDKWGIDETGEPRLTAAWNDEVRLSLDWEYGRRCQVPSDIIEHLPRLRRLAEECDHITEFGTRLANSTTALLAARPKTLVSFDIEHKADADIVQHLRGTTDVQLRTADVLATDIEPTDLLFIDTIHTERQLRQELARHAHRVRRYIVLHDTDTYADVGEDGSPGLRLALTEFLSQHEEWRVQEHYASNHGLTVLGRRSPVTAPRSPKVFIGVPILNRLDLLDRCLAAIDYPAEIVIVNNNTVDGEFKARLESMAASQGFRVLHQARNLGVSGSWNLIARTGFGEGHEWVFIGSNDTFLRPGSVRAAVEFPKEPHVALYHLEYYNFFMVSQRTIDDVGWFDENFYPAYKEDQDYTYRCALAGRRRINIIGASGEHVGSATIHSNPHYLAQNARTHGEWNNAYYVRKWGADADSEVFARPFNDPDHDHRWWPDPGDSIAERDWDRVAVGG